MFAEYIRLLGGDIGGILRDGFSAFRDWGRENPLILGGGIVVLCILFIVLLRKIR